MEIYGDFEVIEEIGQGGFGTVYKAREINTNELFAIKVPTEEFREEFSREIVGIRGLIHENIIGFRGDYVTPEGKPYLVMEYASEGSLEDKLIDGPINYNDAVDIAIELLNGLEYAHSKGVIHCDIKPGNILFNKGVSKLSDFGLYKSVNQEKSGLLQSLVSRDRKRIHKTKWSSGSKGDTKKYHSFLGGTMNYTAPEHWEGLVDPRNDLYSLGIVLYQMITGRFPSLKPASKLVEEVPEQLDVILEKALESISKRYQTAEDLKSDLKSVINTKLVPGKEKTDLEKAFEELEKDDAGKALRKTIQNLGKKDIEIKGMYILKKEHSALSSLLEYAGLSAEEFLEKFEGVEIPKELSLDSETIDKFELFESVVGPKYIIYKGKFLKLEIVTKNKINLNKIILFNNLQHLILYGSKIINIDSIGAYQYLKEFSLNDGRLKLPKDMSIFSNLEILSLYECNISHLPETIGELRKLKKLKLVKNKLRSIPTEIGNLENLEQLALAYNKLKKLPDSIRKLSKLKILHLRTNKLHQIPKEVGMLINLEQVSLAHNNLSSFPIEISNLKKLKILEIDDKNIKNLPPEFLEAMRENNVEIRIYK